MKKTTKTLIATVITTVALAAGSLAQAHSAPVSDSGSIKFAAFNEVAAQSDLTQAVAWEDLTNGNVCGMGC